MTDIVYKHCPLGSILEGALFYNSPGPYRYALYRYLGDPLVIGGSLLWVMLNPSTADQETDDATIRKIVKFSKVWGFSELLVVNLFAWRSTDPKALKDVENPVGPVNDEVIRHVSTIVDRVIVAWGANGDYYPARTQEVYSILLEEHKHLWCLGNTKSGQPKHPLYLKGDTKPQPFSFES